MVMIRRGVDFAALTLIALYFLHGFTFGVPIGNDVEWFGIYQAEIGQVNPKYTNNENSIVEFKLHYGIITLNEERV